MAQPLKLTGPTAKLRPTNITNLRELVETVTTYGRKVVDNGDGTSSITGINELESSMNLTLLQLIVTAGGELEGWNTYAEMDETKHNTNVPLAFPDSHFINEDGTQGARKTWAQWSHTSRQYNSLWYKKMDPRGKWMKASEILQVDGIVGVSIKSKAEMQAIIAANSTGP